MFRAIIFLSVSLITFASYATEQYETVCKQNDCFQFGWTTTGGTYRLDTECKKNDCKKYGWHSIADDQSTYDVTCKPAGCFEEGWESVQRGVLEALYIPLNDSVTCKPAGCLKAGWTVDTGYDLMGGDVTCFEPECSTDGGQSRWRGRDSHTQCYNHDCYKFGWTLFIE